MFSSGRKSDVNRYEPHVGQRSGAPRSKRTNAREYPVRTLFVASTANSPSILEALVAWVSHATSSHVSWPWPSDSF